MKGHSVTNGYRTKVLPSMMLVVFCLMTRGSFAETIGGDFTLTDHNNQEFSLVSARGKAVVLFFGYTSCPDVCPAGLADISMVLKSLDERSKEIIALFVTVDPERDTSDRLSSYVRWFHRDIIGLTGTKSQIDHVTGLFRAQYRLNKKNQDDNSYSVDHNANLFLIDRKGQLSQIIPFGLPIEHKKQALSALLDQ